MSTDAGHRTRRGISRISSRAAAFLLPSLCLACGQSQLVALLRGGICEACWEAIAAPEGPRCERCDEPVLSPEPGFCGRCLLHPPEFRRLSAGALYRGAARSILLAFKFRGADYLAPHLAAFLAANLPIDEETEEVVPVPALARERRRRDHAADLLAAAVARQLRLPFSATRLEKVRETKRQSALPLERRAENVRGAFRARRPVPRHILLVDDVATSGSTARDCARALIVAGAETVDVWCFARAAREDELPGSGESA